MAATRVPWDWLICLLCPLPKWGAGLTPSVHMTFVLCNREELCSQRNRGRRKEKLGVNRLLCTSVIVFEFQTFSSLGVLWLHFLPLLPCSFPIFRLYCLSSGIKRGKSGGRYLKWELQIPNKGSSLPTALVCTETKKTSFLVSQ